ncbi:C40 family peptidase [Nucisporomicrobium flavum]|uniref:C40 family peptidase n=1 Tax=Nucisporomicrobium flavum TaxID=2785915 RepID=UPI003C2C1A3D
MGRVIAAALGGLVLLLVLIAAAGAGVVSALFGGGSAAYACSATVTTPGTTPSGLTAEQATNAGVIIFTGQRLGIPPRGWVIAIATALQESDLVNSPTATDHDSVGLFQQRPSQGWGTVAQLTDPVYAATRFYQALQRVPRWRTLELTEAAQAVQRSAYPHAYAQHEARAASLVAAYTGGTVCDGGDNVPATATTLPPRFTLSAGTPRPLGAAIGWALGQLGTPYTFGGDCTAAHSGVPAHQCDCSSLMQQAYRHAGYSIPRVTADQVHAGTPVPGPAALLPGDLIFVPGSDGTMSRPRHVGMYLGSGLIVQAPKTGDVVKIIKLSAWTHQIAEIRRIVAK